MPSTNSPFETLVISEVKELAVERIAKKLSVILDNAMYSVNRVFASSDPEKDTPEAKKGALASMLRTVADGTRDSESGTKLTYMVEEHKYRGTAYDGTFDMPAEWKARSMSNRARAVGNRLSD